MTRTLRAAAALTAIFVGVAPSIARAETPPFSDAETLAPPPSTPPAAEPPTEPRYLRAILVEIGLLAVGNVDYLLNTGARGGTPRPGDRRWDLRYDWPTFERKLSGDLWRVDGNQFNTNYISHPFAGTMFYMGARANDLSILESAGYATATSLGWEYFSELREVVSVNDVVVTPAAGVAIGETFTRLGAFFARSRENVPNGVLAFLFTPMRLLLDVADGRSHAHAPGDRNGLATDAWRAFMVYGGPRLAAQSGSTPEARRARGSARGGVDMRLVGLPAYDGAGHASVAFRHADVARFVLEGSPGSARLVDARFSTRVVPAGLYEHHVEPDREGRLRGHGGFVGLLVTFDYTVHDLDRDGARPLDLVVTTSPLGVSAEHTLHRGGLRLRSGLDVSAIFAGYTPYALDAFRARARSPDDAASALPSVLAEKNYAHGLGVNVTPSVQVLLGALDAGVRASVDSIQALQGLDEREPRPVGRISDRRVVATVWAGLTHARSGIGLRFEGEGRVREGEVHGAAASRSEIAITGATSWRF